MAISKDLKETSADVTETSGFVLTSVLTRPFEKRRGRESNPRIAVLQTATLPLGYPADFRERTISLSRRLYQAPSIETQVFAATTASARGQSFNASANPVIVIT